MLFYNIIDIIYCLFKSKFAGKFAFFGAINGARKKTYWRVLMNINKEHELIYAIINGDLKRVKSLVKQGADIDYKENYALRKAVYYGHRDIVEYLESLQENEE